MVDEDLCILCGTCEKSCPKKAIALDEKVVIDPDECVECGTCVELCPTTALLFE
jgi:NAD-dependent dihydropyrimidine dehydrogenase PreA subunit